MQKSVKEKKPKQKKLRLRWMSGAHYHDVTLSRDKALAKLMELASLDEKVLINQHPLYT